MLIPFGVFSAAGAGGGGGAAGSYDLISTTILTGTQSAVTFSSLDTYSSTYKHLQIRMTSKDNRGLDSSRTYLQFNADTGANYKFHGLDANSSAGITSYTGFSSNFINFDATAGNSTSGVYGTSVIDILDAFSTTKNKTVRIFAGQVTPAYKAVQFISGLWLSTSAVTSITLDGDLGDFVSGSRFSIYGLKG